jgi:hypothetical protein
VATGGAAPLATQACRTCRSVLSSAMAQALYSRRFDQHALLENALLREQVVELLEVRDVAGLELAAEQVIRHRHLGRQRAFDGGVALQERPRLDRRVLHQVHALGVGGDVFLCFVRILLDEPRSGWPRRHARAPSGRRGCTWPPRPTSSVRVVPFSGPRCRWAPACRWHRPGRRPAPRRAGRWAVR